MWKWRVHCNDKEDFYVIQMLSACASTIENELYILPFLWAKQQLFIKEDGKRGKLCKLKDC